jgi:hypothetical protein
LKNKIPLFSAIILSVVSLQAQNSTSSPYSRYGVGEMAQNTFAHNAGMGGANIALKPDSTMPIFINAGNPAAYSLIKLTTLEVGGRFMYSQFKGAGATSLKTWGTNFSYGALGFPVRENGGACFGIMPYSFVGYDTQSESAVEGIGTVKSQFAGNGGLNKAFLGYGIMPFNKRLIKYRTKNLYIPDSVKTKSHFQYKAGQLGSKLLSDLSLGFNAQYIFGTVQNTTRIIYPSSALYNNTYRERSYTMGDFTGNFGLQTALTVDSVKDPKKRIALIKQETDALRAMNVYSEAELTKKSDSLNKYMPSYNRALKEKVKVTFGFIASLQNPMKVSYNSVAYNYIVTSGQEIIRDTALYDVDQRKNITLPMEQGFGIGFKKGERINLVADFALTDWQSFKFVGSGNDLVNNYRTAIGINFVPEKYAAGRGAFLRRVNYRFGFSYQTGYIKIQNAVVSDYFISAGIGLPVGIGRLSSMVNVSAQYGQMGSPNPALLKQNYYRINFGFTFCDKWFQKYRYD